MLDDPVGTAVGIGGATIPAFPTLPPGTPGYAIALVAVAVIVVAIVWFAAKFVKPREAASTPAPATSTTPVAPPAASPAAEADYRMARETIDRLEKQLQKAEGEQDAMRAAYDRQVERNHELEKQLLARDNTLASARDEIATLRANLTALQRPWGSQYVVPPPPAPRQQSRRPPTHDVFDPDAPTDPLDTSPSRPGARP